MGYQFDIEQVSDERLIEEIDRRARLRTAGNCSYCGNAAGVKPGCAMATQHMIRTRGISETAIDTVVNDMRYVLGTKK